MLDFAQILFLLVLGGFAGLMAGLLGVGGGLIIVPALLFFFEQQNFSNSYLTQMAVATSLATIIFTSVSSIRTHHVQGLVDWVLVRDLTLGIALGALVGAFFAVSLKGQILQLAFGVFAVLIAFQMFFQFQPENSKKLPGFSIRVLIGAVIAFVSSIFGIGGGSLTVPTLNYLNVEIKNAVAISSACGFPIALFAVAGFYFAGIKQTDFPHMTFAYVYLPALFCISIASIVTAHFGAKLAHRLPEAKLKKIFSLLLMLIGFRLVISSFS